MSEVKTNKISSLASNNDITLDPDGTGKTVVQGGDDNYFFAVKGATYGLRYNSNTSSTQMMIEAVDDTLVASHEPLFIGGSTVNLGIAGSTKMVIASDGKIGIGETSPLGTAHIRTSDASITSVNGNADELILENNGNCGMSIASNTGGEGNINFIDSGDTNIGRIQYTHADDFMRFRINDAERFRISSTGRMEMQTPTAETGVLQSCRIDWRNENNAGIMAGIGVVRTAAGNAPGAFVIRTSTNVDSASNNSDGEISEKFRVAPNGDLTATDTSISSNSDQRLKENIADFEYDLTKFKQFQTRTFDWKQPHLHGDKSDVRGFIAQELETVDSYWVQEIEVQSDSDDYQYLPDTDLPYGPNNNYKPDDAAETDTERTARFAKTSKLGQKDAMYVSVIQQLLTKIETLETKVAALEAGE